MAIAKKKKRFFDVEIPIIHKTTQLLATEIKELEGRIIKYDLTRILRGKNILLNAKVKVKGEKATSTPIEIQLMSIFLKRMVRKGTDYAEGSFKTKTKDNDVQIKFLLVTRRRVSRAVLNALRKKAQEELISYLSTSKTEEVFEDIMKNKLQKDLSVRLKKIYPLSLCEIRSFEIIDKKVE